MLKVFLDLKIFLSDLKSFESYGIYFDWTTFTK